MKNKLILLKSKQDFSKFRRSKLFSTKSLRVRVVYALNQNTPRFGFIIPKKIMPKVVDRNVVKRRLKNIIQTNLSHLKSYDYLLFPNSGSQKEPFKNLEMEFISLWKKNHLWQ